MLSYVAVVCSFLLLCDVSSVLVFYHLFIHSLLMDIRVASSLGLLRTRLPQVFSYMSLGTNQRVPWLRHRAGICSKDAKHFQATCLLLSIHDTPILEGVSWCSTVVYFCVVYFICISVDD